MLNLPYLNVTMMVLFLRMTLDLRQLYLEETDYLRTAEQCIVFYVCSSALGRIG